MPLSLGQLLDDVSQGAMSFYLKIEHVMKIEYEYHL